MVASLEMLSGRLKKESAKEAQAVATAEDATDDTPGAIGTNGAANDLEAVVAM